MPARPTPHHSTREKLRTGLRDLDVLAAGHRAQRVLGDGMRIDLTTGGAQHVYAQRCRGVSLQHKRGERRRGDKRQGRDRSRVDPGNEERDRFDLVDHRRHARHDRNRGVGRRGVRIGSGRSMSIGAIASKRCSISYSSAATACRGVRALRTHVSERMTSALASGESRS